MMGQVVAAIRRQGPLSVLALLVVDGVPESAFGLARNVMDAHRTLWMLSVFGKSTRAIHTTLHHGVQPTSGKPNAA
jgi:hypothetical protein